MPMPTVSERIGGEFAAGASIRAGGASMSARPKFTSSWGGKADAVPDAGYVLERAVVSSAGGSCTTTGRCRRCPNRSLVFE